MELTIFMQRISLKRVVVTSFAVDILDVFLSFAVAFFSGSTVMLTEGLAGASDLVASGILLLGFHKSTRKSDKSHPFGYGKEIYFWALVSALLTFGATSSMSIYLGWQRFMHPHPLENLWLAFIVLLIAICTNGYAFLLSFRRLLRRRHPKQIIQIFYKSSLVETKTTFILDFMGTIAALVGIIALVMYLITGDYRLDGLGAIFMGIAVAIGSLFLVSGIRDLVVGRSASPEVERRISKAALKVREVEDVLGIKTLHMGPERLLVNLDVHMSAHLTTRQLEKLIDKIKREIKKEVPAVKFIQVELETPRE